MRLKRVRVFGFKTFADRTDFDVDGSVIAVVGPNGCGKSNLVDAILWGLGEGSPRQLRAETGQDVIFAGSKSRKPLGYAEVTLLFDNEDGALPLETSEVAITRRLTRAGESEYEINRRNCRLKDILELLADSGLGRAGYAIVGQRDIDQALAASPEDRRDWIDEAAGVMRYRTRKSEALRRLQSAQQHLTRVADLLTEIEAQREPLKDESGAARTYKSILSSLKEVESGLLIVEVAKAAHEVDALQSRIDETTRLGEKECRLGDSLERELQRATDTISHLEKSLDSLRARQHKALTDFERAEADLKLGEQKLKSLTDLEEGISEEAGTSTKRVTEAESELKHAADEAEGEDRKLEETRVVTAGAGQEAKELSDELKAMGVQIAKARSLHAELLKHEAEEAHRKERLADIRRESKGIEESLPELREGAFEAERALADQANGVSVAESAIEKLRSEIAGLDAGDEGTRDHARKLLSARAQLEGKIRGIEATISAHEGLQQGARAVLDAARSKKLEGKFTPVGEAIEVPKEIALAIDTALGGAANDLIVDDERQAKAAIGFLKETGGGRATFQPLSLMRPARMTPDLEKVLARKGVVGRASELVKCDARYRLVVESLLGRVVIVENLDDAFALAKSFGWNRIVTQEGEVLHHSGSVAGGHGSKPAYGMVQRKADLAELRKQVQELDKQTRALGAEESKRQKAREKIEEKIERAKGSLVDNQREVQEARDWLQSLTDELNSTLKAQEKLLSELRRLEQSQAKEVESVDLAQLETKRDEILKQLAARSADAEQADERLREAEQRLAQARLRKEQAERRLQHLRDLQRGRERKLHNLEPERKKAWAEIAEAEKQRELAVKERENVGRELHSAQEKRRDSLDRSLQLTEQIKQARVSAQKATEQAHQAELSRARSDARRANSAQRLLEEYGITEDHAVAKAPEIEIPKDAAAVTSRLRRELKSMGDVNLGAIEAYERLTTRFDALHEQREDILGGIREIESSVRELDSLTRERFRKTFEQVQGAFAEMFDKLFPGGVGKVRLTDPNDLLSSGIEIDITLAGKKRQKLELLSGGERSLCATAFLFALLKVKPSPLVVLDEVDAPLDGRNVERFNELLREFATTAQFIVITHNPATIAAAPVWIGVTMQEPGVSTLVPARLPVHTNGGSQATAVVLSPAT